MYRGVYNTSSNQFDELKKKFGGTTAILVKGGITFKKNNIVLSINSINRIRLSVFMMVNTLPTNF